MMRTKHKDRKRNPLKNRKKRKALMSRILDEAEGFLSTGPNDLKRINGAKSVIQRIRDCQSKRINGKLKYCSHQHYCDVCNYIRRNNIGEALEAYRVSTETEKRKGRLYFYVRDECFEFPDGIDWERVDKVTLPFLLKRKKRLRDSLERGISRFKGNLSRIEIAYRNGIPMIRLRSMWFTDKTEMHSMSVFWQPYTEYEENHYARVKYAGTAYTRTAIKCILERYYGSNVYKGFKTSPEDIAGFLKTFYNKATFTTGGDIFKRN